LIPSGILRGKLHCLKSRSPWCAVKPPLQTSEHFPIILIFLKIDILFIIKFYRRLLVQTNSTNIKYLYLTQTQTFSIKFFLSGFNYFLH
jgi:hypothetical protein